MPAGLDGDPTPLQSECRAALIAEMAELVTARYDAMRRPVLIAVDGIDGAGKTTFASELAVELTRRGRHTVCATIDSFHRPQRDRWRRGRASPIGFYEDSHDLDALRDQLLGPFRAGTGQYRTAVFDVVTDTPVGTPPCTLLGDEILLFDGIFLLRDELRTWWDLSIHLDGRERVALRRLGLVATDLPSDPDDVIRHVLDWVARLDRYTSGMRIYFDAVDPLGRADVVVDNNDLANPVVVGHERRTRPPARTRRASNR